VKCAVEMQNRLASGGSPLTLRVGLNLGDVIVGQDGDLRRGDQYCCPAGDDRRSTRGYI
jgi:class 3 adenylate cyclase